MALQPNMSPSVSASNRARLAGNGKPLSKAAKLPRLTYILEGHTDMRPV